MGLCGLPAGAPAIESQAFAAVEAARDEWTGGRPAAGLATADWTTHEWLHFLRALPDGMSGEQMAELPARVRWKADNYNHLLEQPVMFYAVALTLALLGAGSGTNLTLAWTYVALRVVHSLHQALWNKIELRFVIFLVSSLVLITLILRAASLVF